MKRAKLLLGVAAAIIAVAFAVPVVLPRLVHSTAESAALDPDRAQQLKEQAVERDAVVVLWNPREEHPAPALALWARRTDPQLIWGHLGRSRSHRPLTNSDNQWHFELVVGQDDPSGARSSAICEEDSEPFAKCTLTVAFVDLSRKRNAFEIFDALVAAEIANSDVEKSKRAPPRLQRFWTESSSGSFRGWDCEASDQIEKCFTATGLQRWLPAWSDHHPHAAFVYKGGGYFLFRGRLVHVYRDVGPVSSHSLVAAAWNALNRQAHDAIAPPPVAAELDDARVHLASCAALAVEKARLPKEPGAQREWARRSAPCVRAADVGVRIADSHVDEAIALLLPISEALWNAEGRPHEEQHRIYEALLAAFARVESVTSADRVRVMSRYLESIHPERARKWMDDARSIALSHAGDANPSDVLRLRHSVAFHYGNQRQAERLAFLRAWVNAVQSPDGTNVAALEPLYMLMDALVTEPDPTELKAAAEELRDAWMRSPQSCAFMRDDEPDKRREAEVGIRLLRGYQVYALRTQQGRAVGPSMGGIVARLRSCFGEGHTHSMLAMRYQQDTTAGRPTNVY